MRSYWQTQAATTPNIPVMTRGADINGAAALCLSEVVGLAVEADAALALRTVAELDIVATALTVDWTELAREVELGAMLGLVTLVALTASWRGP